VIVRDSESKRVAGEFGCRGDRLLEAPDLVFLTGRQAKLERHSRGSIGLAINGTEAMKGKDEWRQLLSNLSKLKRPLIFLSNGMNQDISFARRLEKEFAIQIVQWQPGYQALRRLYSEMDVLISSRLHAAILALSVGVPVISIESQLFKITSVFEQMNYPYPTDSLLRTGWSTHVCDRVRDVLTRRSDLMHLNVELVQTQIKRIYSTYDCLFSLIADNSTGRENEPSYLAAN
jgi:polysaccharide pyruvyl transferase WcaK-like protein